MNKNRRKKIMRKRINIVQLGIWEEQNKKKYALQKVSISGSKVKRKLSDLTPSNKYLTCAKILQFCRGRHWVYCEGLHSSFPEWPKYIPKTCTWTVSHIYKLRGVQIGLKSYAWFQNRTSAQREFDLKSQVSFSDQNCTTRSSTTTLLDPLWNHTI